MTREILWGRSKCSTKVHLFIDGKRQCLMNCRCHKEPLEAAEVFPNWDPKDPDTCTSCRERYRWFKKGAIPISQLSQLSQTS